MSTCDQLDLQTLESQPVMPKISPVTVQNLQEIFRSLWQNLWNILQLIKKTERCQHVTGWTRRHQDLDRLCPRIYPDIVKASYQRNRFSAYNKYEPFNVFKALLDGCHLVQISLVERKMIIGIYQRKHEPVDLIRFPQSFWYICQV